MDEHKWTQLGAVAPLEIARARVELHWAAQILAAAADALLERAEDDSHTNLRWSHEHGALLGRPLGRGQGRGLGGELRLGLRVADLSLIVVDGERVGSVQALRGMTIADGLLWAQEALASEKALAIRDYAMPVHPLGEGGAFGEGGGSFVELGRYYGAATTILGEFASREEGATSVAVWPHHFDLGGILFMPAKPEIGGEEAPQIGFGMSPGDGSIPEPYFYVTPWPLAQSPDFPPLEGGGVWHREGFTGALLRASTIVEGGVSGGEQRARVARFLASALAASRALILARP